MIPYDLTKIKAFLFDVDGVLLFNPDEDDGLAVKPETWTVPVRRLEP